MKRVNFDMDALRSFLTGIELGSFARAADRLGRSTSAISMQLKKLEEQAGVELLRKAGRGLELTASGEVLLGYARRIIELNDEAHAAAADLGLSGAVKLGLQEDFGERLLPEVLGRFARSHPELQIEALIARNSELMAQVQAAKVDLALAWQLEEPMPHADILGEHALEWIGQAAPGDGDPFAAPVRLVVLPSPCRMRSAATEALDRAGIPWRIVFTSPSLSGVWAAVAAGLGITVRTRLGLPANLATLDGERAGLPPLPTMRLALFSSEARPAPAAQRMHAIIKQAIEGLEDGAGRR